MDPLRKRKLSTEISNPAILGYFGKITDLIAFSACKIAAFYGPENPGSILCPSGPEIVAERGPGGPACTDDI